MPRLALLALLALLLAGCIDHHAIAQRAPARPIPQPVAWKDLLLVIPLHGALDHIFGPGTKAQVRRRIGFDLPF